MPSVTLPPCRSTSEAAANQGAIIARATKKPAAATDEAREVARIRARGDVDFKLRLLDWVGRAAVGLVIVLALWVGRPMVHDLAGKDTNVNFVGQIGWGTTAVAGAGWANAERRRKATLRQSAKGIPSIKSLGSVLEREAP